MRGTVALRHILLAGVLWLGLPAAPLWSWGSEVHRLVNGQAAEITPGPLGSYLRQQRQWLVALSTAPDHRREFDRHEGPNHYIDFEYFGDPPYRSIPHDYREAEEKYSADSLAKWGVLPWRIIAMTGALKHALETGEWERAVVLAAGLGHYVADGHQPLHTTANYNGQLTGNDGVHHMFETVMLNQHLEDIPPPVEPPAPIEDLPEAVFGWLRESFGEVEGLLVADSQVRAGLTDDEKEVVAQSYSAAPDAIPQAYLDRLYARTGPMAWRRVSLATSRLASLWLWAWKEAGQPTPPQ